MLKTVKENFDLLYQNMKKLEDNLKILKTTKDEEQKIIFIKNEILSNMTQVRIYIDNLEGIVDKTIWPLPTYADILYYDA